MAIKQDIIKNLSARRIIEMCRRDKEKPMGVLLVYIRDMYGLTKTQGWDIAEGVLEHYHIENKMY